MFHKGCVAFILQTLLIWLIVWILFAFFVPPDVRTAIRWACGIGVLLGLVGAILWGPARRRFERWRRGEDE